MKSGKFTLGTKTAVKTLRNGKGASQTAWESVQTSQAHWLLAVGLYVTSNARRVCARDVSSVARRATDMRAVVICAAKLIIISNNTPPIRKSEIEYYAMLSKTGVHHYGGSAPFPRRYNAFLCDLQRCLYAALVWSRAARPVGCLEQY